MPAKTFHKAFVTPVILLLALFAFCSSSLAQSGDAVGIVVYVIEASDGVPGVDPEIRSIVKQFHETFRYSTYKLISKVPRKIPIGETTNISLPGSRALNIGALGHEGERIKLKVKIAKEEPKGKSRDVLNTEFRLGKGSSMVIGGYDYQEGKLILTISADK
jgi:hypothetical protein